MSMVYENKFKNELDASYYLKFLYHRFSRIYPLYFSILLFMFWHYSSNGSNINNEMLTTNIFLMQGLFGGSLVGASWSVSVEIIAYVFFPIFCHVLAKKSFLSIPLFCVSFLCIYSLPLINTAHGQGPLDIYNGVLSIFRGTFGFMLGVTSWFISKNISKNVFKNAFTCDAIFIAMIIVLFHRKFDMIFVLLCVLYITSLFHGYGISQYILASKPFVLLGEISFSIYMTHLIFQRIYGAEIMKLSSNHFGTYEYSSIILMIAFTLITSIFTYLIIEKPLRKILRGLENHLFGS